MKTAESWFDEGLAALELARGADRVSELMGDYERAVHAFEQALALDPAHSGAIRERALTLSRLHQPEAALDALMVAVKLEPNDPTLRLAAAHALVSLKQTEAALEAFEAVLRLRADSRALIGRAQMLSALRRDAEAVTAWDAVLSGPKDPFTAEAGGPPALLARATSLAHLDKPEASAAFASAFQGDLRPEDLIAALREFEVARVAYRAHLEKNPSARALHQAGLAWNALGLHPEAVRAWERLVLVEPDAPWAWAGKGKAHEDAGEFDGALTAWERSLALWPQSRAAAEAIVRVRKAAQHAPG